MPRSKQGTFVRRRPLHGKTCSGTTQASWIPSWAACLVVCPSISPFNRKSEHLFHGTHEQCDSVSLANSEGERCTSHPLWVLLPSLPTAIHRNQTTPAC